MATVKTIDPIYRAFTKRVLKTISSTEFYDYFMQSMLAGTNNFQFTNTRVEKYVDEKWVDAIEKCMKPMEEIINNPRNFIVQEEVIVNIALAKQVTPESIRHLGSHGNMIDKYDEEDGNIRPNKLMEKYKEDSWDTYENKFVYTLIDMTYDFVDKRYEAIFNALQGEYGAHMILKSDVRNYQEKITSNVELRIQEDEDIILEDEKNESVFSRIARLHRLLGNYKSTPFYKEMVKHGKVKPPLVPTNAIKKNPNFKACHKLWNFILAYTDVGYKIEIFKQNSEIGEEFALDLYHSIMIDYIVLKHHLELKKDRAIDTTKPHKKKVLKPHFIKEIIEEIVKNYDLPDVEVRKVLIEEITKAQLMQEAEEERMRLVAEKEKEMKAKALAEEKERKRQERIAERERLKAERLAELEAVRQAKEKQKELERLDKEKKQLAQEESERIYRIKNEFESMYTEIAARKKAKADEEKKAKKASKPKAAKKAKTKKVKTTKVKKEPESKKPVENKEETVDLITDETVNKTVEVKDQVINEVPAAPVQDIPKEEVKPETAVKESDKNPTEPEETFEEQKTEDKKGLADIFRRKK